MNPDEVAKKVLETQMAPSQMKFSEFRWAIINEAPEYISDDDIHDLYMRHVVLERGKKEPPDISKEHAQRILDRSRPSEVNVASTPPDRERTLHPFGTRDLDPFGRRDLKPPIEQAIDQIVEHHDAKRPSVQEVKKVAYSRRKKKRKSILRDALRKFSRT